MDSKVNERDTDNGEFPVDIFLKLFVVFTKVDVSSNLVCSVISVATYFSLSRHTSDLQKRTLEGTKYVIPISVPKYSYSSYRRKYLKC